MKKSELKQIIKEEVIDAFKSSPLLRESWSLTEASDGIPKGLPTGGRVDVALARMMPTALLKYREQVLQKGMADTVINGKPLMQWIKDAFAKENMDWTPVASKLFTGTKQDRIGKALSGLNIKESKASDNWIIEPENGKFRAVSPAGTKSKDLFNTKEEAQKHIDKVLDQYGPQNETISDHEWPQANCSQCNKQVDEIDLFPGSICLDCYEHKMRHVPLHKLGKPDFVGALRKEGKEHEKAFAAAVSHAKSLSAEADRRGTWASHRDAQNAWYQTTELDTDRTHSPEGLRRMNQYNKYSAHHATKAQQAPDHPARLKRLNNK